jgi:predicted PilT family ATPase
MDLENKLWISIDVDSIEKLLTQENENIKITSSKKGKKKVLVIDVGKDFKNKDVYFKIGNDFVRLTTDSNWKIQIKNKSLIKK